jgi:hypothetical protein
VASWSLKVPSCPDMSWGSGDKSRLLALEAKGTYLFMSQTNKLNYNVLLFVT